MTLPPARLGPGPGGKILHGAKCQDSDNMTLRILEDNQSCTSVSALSPRGFNGYRIRPETGCETYGLRAKSGPPEGPLLGPV